MSYTSLNWWYLLFSCKVFENNLQIPYNSWNHLEQKYWCVKQAWIQIYSVPYTFICSKTRIETLEKDIKHVQSWQ